MSDGVHGNPMHPQVSTPAGGTVFINPGTGPVANANRELAAAAVEQLIRDVELEGVTAEPTPAEDYGRGRFAFMLRWQNVEGEARECEIQMPGLPIEQVRYLGEAGQDIWDFPRLYVEGSSWVWLYAIGCTRTVLVGDDEG